LTWWLASSRLLMIAFSGFTLRGAISSGNLKNPTNMSCVIRQRSENVLGFGIEPQPYSDH
jgi:hypothetical protein